MSFLAFSAPLMTVTPKSTKYRLVGPRTYRSSSRLTWTEIHTIQTYMVEQ